MQPTDLESDAPQNASRKEALFCKRLTEHPADAHHRLEDGAGEARLESQGDPVRETQVQGLVLRQEEQLGISVDAVFLQSPGRTQQPPLLLVPPQCMVRPVAFDLCRHKTHTHTC